MPPHHSPGRKKVRSPAVLRKNEPMITEEVARLIGGRKVSHETVEKLHVLIMNRRRPGIKIEQRREIEAEIARVLAQALSGK